MAWLEKKPDRDLKYKELQLEEQRKEREFQQRKKERADGAYTEATSNARRKPKATATTMMLM